MRIVWHKRLMKPVFDVMRSVCTPSATRRCKFRFVGKFEVDTEDGSSFMLCDNYHLESALYRAGRDRLERERSTRRVWMRL